MAYSKCTGIEQLRLVKNGHFLRVTKTYPRYLSRYIRFFYSVVEDEYKDVDSIHRRLPDGTLDLVFNLGAPVFISRDNLNFSKIPRAVLTGLHQDRSFIRYGGNIEMVGVVFQPGYAHHFISDSLENYKSCFLDATSVYGTEINSLTDRLKETRIESDRHRIIEQFLMKYLNCREMYYSDRISSIIKQIQLTHGNIDIKGLHQSHNMSERTFRRKFQEQVGMSPKQYSSIVRIKAFSKYFEQQRTNFGDIIFSLGFSDQSHFNKEFKRIVGVAPTNYFSQLNEIGSEFVHLI